LRIAGSKKVPEKEKDVKFIVFITLAVLGNSELCMAGNFGAVVFNFTVTTVLCLVLLFMLSYVSFLRKILAIITIVIVCFTNFLFDERMEWNITRDYASTGGRLKMASSSIFHFARNTGGDTLYIIDQKAEAYDAYGTRVDPIKIGTPVFIKNRKDDRCWILYNSGKEAWVKKSTISRTKPDLEKPHIVIFKKQLSDSLLYVKGAVFDNNGIEEVTVLDTPVRRQEFSVEQGNYRAVYPFELRITMSDEYDQYLLIAKDKSGNKKTMDLMDLFGEESTD
jgi:hypothetical protein